MRRLISAQHFGSAEACVPAADPRRTRARQRLDNGSVKPVQRGLRSKRTAHRRLAARFATVCCAVVGAACAAPEPEPQIRSGAPTADWPDRYAEYDAAIGDVPEYRAIQARLATGWNTWDSRSVLRYVLLPEGLAVNLGLKRHAFLDESHLEAALIGRREEGAETVRPGIRAADGSYQRLEIAWRGLSAVVEAGHDDSGELVVLVTPEPASNAPFELVVSAGMAWNRPGSVESAPDGLVDGLPDGLPDGLVARLPDGEKAIRVAGILEADPYAGGLTPHRVVRLTGPVGVFTGRRGEPPKTTSDIRRTLDARRQELEARAAEFGELAEAWLAVTSGFAWNTVYEPRHGRVVPTVGRLWNQEYGGVALFGWDNFFLGYLASLESRDLALAAIVEHLRGHTAEGFLANDNRGNGSKSWDRSQPPVGGIMVREVYRRFPERWFLEAAFEPLLAWNRWWPAARKNGDLLSYGSHEAKNPFAEPVARTKTAAGYESGMDDSPMYEDVPFNREQNVLELQDVGLTSLYIADCRALSELARLLGRTAEADELEARADAFGAALDTLWVEERGYYLNYRTDLGRPSERRSPTLFYPLLAGVASESRASRLIREHLLNPGEFWGEFVLPSTTRDDPSFPRQRYWKGAIWPPLNFLTYLGLRRAGDRATAAELSARSLDMFLREWRRKGYVSENISSISGTGDDERLSSDPFHSWGALFGIMAFIESGHLAAPEDPLPAGR